MVSNPEIPQPRRDAWFRSLHPNNRASVRLFCFPHAGGGASAYAQWHRFLSPEIEVIAVQLPGHENRSNEPLLSEMGEMVTSLSQHFRSQYLEHRQNIPSFVFFGHSMGALLAFELARNLRRQGQALPALLIVSGHCAPHLKMDEEMIHLLPDSLFLQKIGEIAGTPRAILESPEFGEVWMPTLRADFKLCEGYIHANEAPLNIPIVAFYGDDDRQVTSVEMDAWAIHSRQKFAAYRLPGEHFYLQTHGDEFRPVLQQVLQTVVATNGGC